MADSTTDFNLWTIVEKQQKFCLPGQALRAGSGVDPNYENFDPKSRSTAHLFQKILYIEDSLQREIEENPTSYCGLPV